MLVMIALLPVWPDISIFSFSSLGFSLFDILSSFETGIGANLRGAGVSNGDFCLSKPVSSTSLEGALTENKKKNKFNLFKKKKTNL